MVYKTIEYYSLYCDRIVLLIIDDRRYVAPQVCSFRKLETVIARYILLLRIVSFLIFNFYQNQQYVNSSGSLCITDQGSR